MRGSSVRALARVAWRDIARHRGRSLLVVVLVALPVAGMVAGISIERTTRPTQDREDIAAMGRADLLATGVSRDELVAHLPAGSVVERLAIADGNLVLPGARPSVQVDGMDLDGLAAGMRTLIEGRLPVGAGEAAISRTVEKLANVGIGGQVTLDAGPTLTVVGIVENPMFLPEPTVLVDPNAVAVPAEFPSWLVALPAGADPQAVVEATVDPNTGEQSVPIQTRSSGRIVGVGGDSTFGLILIFGAIALVEAALIASAAFAVSIRRRQRELGLLAATGATPGQLSGTVVIGAAILGSVAAVAGVVLGLIGAVALSPWLDDLTQHRNPALVIDLPGMVGPVAIGFGAAVVAAIVPARTVARVPVLVALSGRRPSQTRARATFRLGLFMVGVAAVMTVVGATMPNAGLDAASLVLLAGGAVVSTLGFGACGPWLLERLGRLADRLPLAGRIAFRDTARARSRSSPILTAILAACAFVVAIGAWQTSRDAEELAGWRPSVYPDQIAIAGPGAAQAGQRLLAEPGAVGGMVIPSLGLEDPDISTTYQLPDARDGNGRLIDLTDQCSNCRPEAFQAYFAWLVAAGTPELLKLAHAESAADELRQGHAVLIAYRPLTATYLEILFQRYQGSDWADVVRLRLPVHVLQAQPYGTLPQLFLPDATIAQLGLIERPAETFGGDTTFVVQFDHPVAASEFETAQAVAAGFSNTFVRENTPPVRAGEGFRIVTIALLLLFAVSVTGIAIALGEAESRPEQRSLLALGADPNLRRRITAARAATLALLAGVLAVPAGLLPVWGMFASRGSPVALPTLEIVGAVVVLPFLAITTSWLLSRPIPDWNAFRNVRPGE